MERYPLRLQAVPRQIIWGGTKLKTEYHKTAPFEKIAESWELTVRPEGVNTIIGGPADGMPLDAYLSTVGSDALGTACRSDRFPLLIKLIDAGDDLSIQVHPDDAYALAHEGETGKTEMWYVMEAEPDARIVYGLQDGISEEDFRLAVDDCKITEVLHYVKVKPGDVFYIPSGQIHALGAGVLIAEIQQSSNITYRVYDYDRRQKDGSLRELHREKAKAVVKVRTDAELNALRFAKPGDPQSIASGEYFKVDLFETQSDDVSFSVDSNSFQSLLCLQGEGFLCWNGARYPLAKGNSYFLPAGIGSCTVQGSVRFLTSRWQE